MEKAKYGDARPNCRSAYKTFIINNHDNHKIMKTKIFTLLLAVAAGVGTMFASVTINGIAYELNGTTATVVSGGNYTGTIVIPASVTYDSKTYTVTSIGQGAFRYCTGLTSVRIGNRVTSIGNSAFQNCTGLTSVIIPNSVTSIVDYAFDGCTGLTSVTIPNSVTSIRKDAFRDCTGFPVIDNIRYADTYLIEAVDKTLSTYTIKDGTKWIGSDAFEGCTGLTSIDIPNSVTSIGYSAFAYCTGLTSVTIPNSVTSIGDCAFEFCRGLTSVTIPNSVTSIGACAFSGCTGLTSIDIPNSVTSIGYGAFSRVNNIVYTGSIGGYYPWNAKSVNGYVEGYLVYKDATKTKLLGCSSAVNGEIVILNSVTSIGNNAFYYCSGLTSVTIPNSVTSIGKYAFYGCSGLTSVTIPNSVPNIGDCAFSGCTGLTSVVWNAKNCADFTGTSTPFYSSNNQFDLRSQITSFTFGDEVERIPRFLCSGMPNLTSVTIPNSVTSIGGGAFSNCGGLTSVTIPNSVTSIEDAAFSGCTGLTSVMIPSSVTGFGNSAFAYCSGLTSVTIPNSVTSIGEDAFRDCTGLTSVTCLAPTPPTCWSSKCFSGVDCSNIPLYVPMKSVSLYQAATIWKGFNVIGVMFADEVETAVFSATPTDDYGVILEWQAVENAILYNIDIIQGNDTIRKLQFDSNGKLLNSPSNAPSRYPNIHHASTAILSGNGWRYEVNDLDPGTNYTYSITVKAENGSVLYTQSIGFTTKEETFIIKFVNWNGEELLVLPEVVKGTTPSYTGETPVRPNTAEYTYTFVGWTPAIVAATSDTTYTATYTATKNSYTITWQNEDGSLIDQTTVEYGVVPTHAEPTKEATEEYTYTFAGWTPAVVAVTGDATYTATFSSVVNVYTITVNAVNGQVLGGGEYQYGTTTDLTAIPDEGYVFDQWSDGVTDNPRTITVTGDVEYTALFKSAEGLENIYTSEPVQKVIIDQKVYILRGEKIYNAQGALVK